MKDKYDSPMDKSDEVTDFRCTACGEQLDTDALLRAYGPEGLYELADILRAAADEDVSDAMGGNDHQME